MLNKQENDYIGLRALMLLRVSTPRQEDGYGWPAQEDECRKRLIEPLRLRLVDTIRDTYSGLEFRERPVLDEILARAKREEFDLLIMDVLDRLGRKGIEREIWRMQLRDTGVRMLSTRPEDHADDDSSSGELMRIVKGEQSEDELNNIQRRTMNGKRAKAEGRQPDGTVRERKMVGNHTRTYGYKFTYSDKGKKEGYKLNNDVILVDENGKEWTEVAVVLFIFESAVAGISTRQLAQILTDKAIPTPTIAKGNKITKRTGPPVWQPSVVQKVLKNSTYWGEYRQFRVRMLDKVANRKFKPYEATPEDEQIIIPVPAIVTKELAEKAHQILHRNQRIASCNNPSPKENLLRTRHIYCAHCGGGMTACRLLATRNGVPYVRYNCSKSKGLLGRCEAKTSVPARPVDNAAWQRALEIIHNPSQVDEKLATLKTDDPTAERRKKIQAKLLDIRKHQTAFRQQLANMMMDNSLDKGTEDFLKDQLRQLTDQIASWETELAKDEDVYRKWKTVQGKLVDLHQMCADIRDSSKVCNYELCYEKKRELIEYFGITARVWKYGHNPRFQIECNPPDIASLT